MNCNIIPKTLDLQGNIVESNLFAELWDKSKAYAENTVQAREMAISLYETAHSIDFLNEFGDWELLKNYHLNNLSQQQKLRLITIYDNNISALAYRLDGKLNQFGEPLTNHVINFKRPKKEIQLSIDDPEGTYNNADMRHINRVLAKYTIQLMDKGESISQEKLRDMFFDEGQKIEEQLERIEEQHINLLSNPKSNADVVRAIENKRDTLATQLEYILKIDTILQDSDFIWNRFYSYFTNEYKIKVDKNNIPVKDTNETKTDKEAKQLTEDIKDNTLDETDAGLMIRSASWDDGLQVNVNKVKSTPTRVKFALARINSENTDTLSGLTEPIELNDVWATMVVSHRNDAGHPAKVLKTLYKLGERFDAGLSKFADMIKNDADLMKAYITATDLSISENKGILMKNVRNMFEQSIQVNNRDAFIEYRVYDQFISTINQEFSTGTQLDAYIKDTQEYQGTDHETAMLEHALEDFQKITGIALSEDAFNDYINDNDNGLTPQQRKRKVFVHLNAVMADVHKIRKQQLTEIAEAINDEEAAKVRSEYGSDVSDVKGDLFALATIQAPYTNVRPSLSYFNNEGSLEYTAQNHSYFTDMFAGLNNPVAVFEAFHKFTLNPADQYHNWLWNTNTKEQTPNGIFNFITDVETGMRIISNEQDVNMQYVEHMKAALYGGNKDLTGGIASKYSKMLSDNWNLNVFVHGFFGTHFLSSSDSQRTFQLQVPKIDIFRHYQDGKVDIPYMKFDEKGNFVSLESERKNAIYEALANTVRREMIEFVNARDAIFDIKNGKLLRKAQFKGKNVDLSALRSPRDIGVDPTLAKNHKDAKTLTLLDKNGNPTGKVFKFNNMSYVENGQAIYFLDHIKQNHPDVNVYLLDQTQLEALLPDFIGKVLESRIAEAIKLFSPIKDKLFSIHSYIPNSITMTKEQYDAAVEEAKIIKNEKDFRQQIASFVINDYVARVELDALILGNQAEYKDAIDRNKRVGQGIKNMIRLNKYTYDGKEATENTYNSLNISDIKGIATIFDKFSDTLRPDILEIYKKQIDAGDGFTIITQDEFINRLKAAGRYNLYEKLINRINDKTKPFNPTDFNNLIESQKFFMYSRDMDYSLYPRMVSTQHKNSTFVLFDRFMEGTQMQDLSTFMKANNVQQVTFNSAVKVSGIAPVTVDNNGTFVGAESTEVAKYVQTLSYGDLGIQVDTKGHLMDEVIKLGVQISRLITNGLHLTGEYSINGETLTGKQLFDHYHELISTNIHDSANELLHEWGALDESGEIRFDEGGNIQVDPAKMYAFLKENVTRNTNDENIHRSVMDNMVEGRPNMSIDSSVNYKKFISVLFAKVRNKVTDQELPGIHASLVPDIFLGKSKDFSDASKIDFDTAVANKHFTYIDSFNEEVKNGTRKDYSLQMTERIINGKKAIVAEVLLNPWLKSMYKDGQVIDINKLTEEERTMIGIRIPTEDKPSMFILEVVGFMNTGASQAVFPADFIVKTGWDFDLDSVFLYRKNIKEHKDGTYEVIQYTTDNANLQVRYNGFINREIARVDASRAYGKEVINQLVINSQEHFDAYLDKMSEVERVDYSDVERTLFEELDTIDNEAVNIQFKIVAKELNTKGIKHAMQRLRMYQEFINDQLEIVKDQQKEAESSGVINSFLEHKFMGLEHLSLVVDDLIQRDRTYHDVRDEAFAEMQSNQRAEWANLQDTITEAYVEKYNLMGIEEFSNLPIVQQNSKKARQNQLIDVMKGILADPKHHDALMRPNQYANITAAGDYVNSLYGITTNNLNSNFFIDETKLRNINMSIRELKGQSVSFDSLMAILGVTGTNIKDGSGIKHMIPLSELGDKYKGMSEAKLKEELSRFYDNENGKNIEVKDGNLYIIDHRLANNKEGSWTDIQGIDIQEQSSEVTANILDAVTSLMGFNINTHTLSVFKILVNQPTTYQFTTEAGTTFNRFILPYLFTHQPIIVDLVNMYNREEIMSSTSNMNHMVNKLRNETLAKLYNLLKDEFNIVLQGNEHLDTFNRQAKGNSMYIDNRNNKEGNYDSFYKALNHILGKKKAFYYQHIESYFTPINKLEQGIKDRTKFENVNLETITSDAKMEYAVYLADQLKVLNSFGTYHKLGTKLVNLATALKFDKADTPTFSDATKLFNSLNNIILSYPELKEALNDAALPAADIQRELNNFKVIVNPRDKIDFVNDLIERYAEENKKVILPTNLFQVDGKNLTEAMFPSLYDSNEASVYPMMEAYFQNNVMLAKKLFSNMFLFETDVAKQQGVRGYSALKQRILGDNNLIGNNFAENTINDYILTWGVKNMPFFRLYKGEELGTENPSAEIGRLLNTANNAFESFKPIHEYDIVKFRQLPLVSKLGILQKHARETRFIQDHPEAHILNLVEIRDTQRDFQENGYHYIIFKNSEVDINLTRQSLRDMYTHSNPIIRDTAEDIIKYAYYMNGLGFGNNVSKAIPVEILYDNRLSKFTEPGLSPGIYSDTLAQERSKVIEGEFHEGDFVQSFHQSKWNNPLFNPVANTTMFISKAGNLTLDQSKPTWKVEPFTQTINGIKKDFNIIIEPTSAVAASKYATKDYVLWKDQNETKLYKRYVFDDITFYYPIQRRLAFETSDTAVQVYKEGIHTELEYQRFIDTSMKEKAFDAFITSRLDQLVSPYVTIKQNKKMASGVTVTGDVTIPSHSPMRNIQTTKLYSSGKVFESGTYRVIDYNGNAEDIGISLNLRGTARTLGKNTVSFTYKDSSKNETFTHEEFVKNNGYESVAEFRKASKTNANFLLGKTPLNVHDITEVLRIDDTSFEFDKSSQPQDYDMDAMINYYSSIEGETETDVQNQPEQIKIKSKPEPTLSETQTKADPIVVTSLNPSNINLTPDIAGYDTSFLNVHGAAYLNALNAQMKHFIDAKDQGKVKIIDGRIDAFIKSKDNGTALAKLEQFVSMPLHEVYRDAYHLAALSNPAIKNMLANLTADYIDTFDVSSELNVHIIEGIKQASLKLKTKPKAEKQIITGDQTLSQTTKTISNESDVSIYIGDQSSNTKDKIVISNMNNPIKVDITKDITSEIDRLISQLPKNKALTLFITGDEYNSMKYSIREVDTYMAKFTEILHHKHPYIYKTKSIVKDGISNALHHQRRLPVEFFETTGGKRNAVFLNPSSVKQEKQLDEHSTPAERNINKQLGQITKMEQQAQTIMTNIENANRLIKSLTIGISDQTVHQIEGDVEVLSTKELFTAIKTHDLHKFTFAVHKQKEIAIYVKTQLEDILEYIEGVSPNDLFGSSFDYSDRAGFVQQIKKGVDLSNSISFVQDLHILEVNDLKDNINDAESILPTHNNHVAELKILDSEVDGLRERLNAVKDRYIHSMVMHWTKNAKFKRSAFQYARENKILNYEDITVEEIQQDLIELFTRNEDLSYMMLWTDSAMSTGVTLMDISLKEYFSSRGAKDMQVEIYTDRFEDALAELLGITDKNEIAKISNWEYKERRKAAFERLVDKETGELLGEYEWGKFHNEYIKFQEELHKIKEERAKLGERHDDPTLENYHELIHNLNQREQTAYANWSLQQVDTEHLINNITEAEKAKIEHAFLNLNSTDYNRFLYANHYRLRYGRTVDTDVQKLIPVDKYKSSRYTKLNDKELKFLNEVKSIINELMTSSYKNFIKPDNFLPIAVDMTTKQAMKMILGLRDIHKLEYYIGLNNDMVYQTKIPMMNMIEKTPSIYIRRRKDGESPTAYEKDVLQKINEYRKLEGDNQFKTLDEVEIYNTETRVKNLEHTNQVRSYDPSTVMNQFIAQTLNYKHKRDFESFYKMMLYEIGSDRFQVMRRGKGKHKNLVDTLKSYLRDEPVFTRASGKDTRVYDRYQAWYDTFAGQSKISTGYDQVLGVIKQYTSMLYMGLNVYGGIKNVTKGLHDIVMEAVAEEYISPKDLKWALENYPYMELLKATRQQRVDNLDVAIIKHHHQMLELKNEKGIEFTDADKEAHRFFMFHDAAYFASRVTEHFMQYTMLMAATKSHRVVGGRTMSYLDYLGEQRKNIIKTIVTPEQFESLEKAQAKQDAKQENLSSDQSVITIWARDNMTVEQLRQFKTKLNESKKQFKTEFEKFENVYDQYVLVDGRARLKEGSTLSYERLGEFERKVHVVNHQLHGVYNTIDQNQLKQTMIGDLLLQFRSWMRPNWNRFFGSRMGRTRFDENLGTFQKGAYVSLWDFVTSPKKGNNIFFGRRENVNAGEAIGKLFTDYKNFLKNASLYYATLPEYDKANIRRAVTNIVQVLGLGATILLLNSLHDEDEDEEMTFALAFTIYQLNMVHSEISQFTLPYGIPGMVSRTKQSVMPAEKVILDTYNLVSVMAQYPFMSAEDKINERGVYKDQDKLAVAAKKNIPFIRQYHKHQNIQSFTAWYRMHNPFSKLFD